jgi:hypothetical protein
MTLNIDRKLKINTSVLAFLILLISFKSSNQWSTMPIGNELFWWVVQLIFIFILFKIKKRSSTKLLESILLPIKLYLIWNIVCILRGVFLAENYWEWKMLISNAYFLMLPIIAYLANNLISAQNVIKTWFNYGLLLFVLFIPFLERDGVGQFLMPISFLLVFLSILSKKWKIICLLITVFIVTFDVSARSNVIKFIVPFLIGLLYYFRSNFFLRFFNYLRIILLLVPILFLFLASFGIFNVFKMDEYLGEQKAAIKSKNGEIIEETLTADTRTFLYQEVINSAINNQYVLFGRTPARGNDSFSFGDYNRNFLKTGKRERFSNEVSILNVFTWLGAIGLVLYFIIFIKASYLALNHSNNIFIKLVGLNISFRWAYGFVEDFSHFDLSTIFLWIMIGMCFSPAFRNMTDQQMKEWVHGVFKSNRKKVNKLQF